MTLGEIEMRLELLSIELRELAKILAEIEEQARGLQK
jgi:hypothetical protein